MEDEIMSRVETPHICADKSDFGKTVLMPGDPLRSQFIAENFLTNPKLVNNIRGVQGYTGEYKGVKVSVMASGMGMPSIGIYSHELFNFFDVENIIRVGSAGGMQDNVKLYDIVIGMSACTNSNYAAQFQLNGIFSPTASYPLMRAAIEESEKAKANYHVGTIYSSDVFYNADMTAAKKFADMGALCVEMEAAALYLEAARAGKNALGIMTISDCIFTGEETDAMARQTSFTQMMEIALNTAVAME